MLGRYIQSDTFLCITKIVPLYLNNMSQIGIDATDQSFTQSKLRSIVYSWHLSRYKDRKHLLTINFIQEQ